MDNREVSTFQKLLENMAENKKFNIHKPDISVKNKNLDILLSSIKEELTAPHAIEIPRIGRPSFPIDKQVGEKLVTLKQASLTRFGIKSCSRFDKVDSSAPQYRIIINDIETYKHWYNSSSTNIAENDAQSKIRAEMEGKKAALINQATQAIQRKSPPIIKNILTPSNQFFAPMDELAEVNTLLMPVKDKMVEPNKLQRFASNIYFLIDRDGGDHLRSKAIKPLLPKIGIDKCTKCDNESFMVYVNNINKYENWYNQFDCIKLDDSHFVHNEESKKVNEAESIKQNAAYQIFDEKLRMIKDQLKAPHEIEIPAIGFPSFQVDTKIGEQLINKNLSKFGIKSCSCYTVTGFGNKISEYRIIIDNMKTYAKWYYPSTQNSTANNSDVMKISENLPSADRISNELNNEIGDIFGNDFSSDSLNASVAFHDNPINFEPIILNDSLTDDDYFQKLADQQAQADEYNSKRQRRI